MAAIEYDEVDPLLVAAIEDLFAAIHPAEFIDDVVTSANPEASQAAYEQMVTGEWDGDIL